MFQMVVDDVFFIRGRGTVLTGTVGAGTVRVGDDVRVGEGPTVRVDGIEAFSKRLDEAQEGQMIGLLLRSLDRSQVKPGDVITAAGDAQVGSLEWPPRG